jgi:hypothetical protein
MKDLAFFGGEMEMDPAKMQRASGVPEPKHL